MKMSFISNMNLRSWLLFIYIYYYYYINKHVCQVDDRIFFLFKMNDKTLF